MPIVHVVLGSCACCRIKALIDAMAADKGKPVCSFNRILLTFPAMRRTLATVKGIFDAADKVRAVDGGPGRSCVGD
jgi:hypothetical protein